MRKILQLGFAALALAAPLRAQFDEYKVKAAFLYNFARFVEWPAHAFKGPEDPLAICILGPDPFHGTLAQAVQGKTVEGRPFEVHQVSSDDACTCHILFVAASGRKRLAASVDSLRGVGVLTIGESPGFAQEGGIINLKLESGKVRFEVNVEAAERAQLRISSKLLSLAEIVKR